MDRQYVSTFTTKFNSSPYINHATILNSRAIKRVEMDAKKYAGGHKTHSNDHTYARFYVIM